MLQMLVHGINLDIITNQPVIILRDLEAHHFLPIWIGQFEATSILMEIQGIKPTRPLTHDLIKSLTEILDAEVTRVVINNLKDGTFYARIHLQKGQEDLDIDSRPSDAIALAVRVGAPIYVTENVMEKASIITEEGAEGELDRFRDFLKDIKPEDFHE